MDIAENAIRLVACIIACAIIAIALGIVSRKKKAPADSDAMPGAGRKLLSTILGAAAALVVVVTIITCVRGLDAKPHIMDEGSDPAAVAENFLASALSGHSTEAEAMLLGSGKLGLDTLPEDKLGSMLYEALQNSFAWEKLGGCTQDSINASQSFTVTYLDIPSLTAKQQEATNARLAQYLDAAARADEVQAEDGSYRPEVAMKALEEVTEELLLTAEEHYVSTELELQLQYSGGEWKVIADEALFAILSGNTAY